jgi:hypothetical protein
MAPKTRFADSPHVSPLDSPDLGSQQSFVIPIPDTLALVMEQMALLNARLDAQSADVVAAAAVVAATIVVADPLSLRAVAMRSSNPLATDTQ